MVYEWVNVANIMGELMDMSWISTAIQPTFMEFHEHVSTPSKGNRTEPTVDGFCAHIFEDLPDFQTEESKPVSACCGF